MHTRMDEIAPYITKDGSEIRELMHPDRHPVRRQSLAEARVAPGARTARHRHRRTEEIYHITAGHGTMELDGRRFAVGPGDTVCIAPGSTHCIENPGPQELRLLCTCTPAYTHEDTELLETSLA